MIETLTKISIQQPHQHQGINDLDQNFVLGMSVTNRRVSMNVYLL